MNARSILFLNRVYPPVEGATGRLLADLARELADGGWQVTVVTSRGSAALPSSAVIDGVRVERVGGVPFTRASHLRRALSYLSLYPALLARASRLPRADIVVTLTDPPLALLLGPLLKWTKRSRLMHWAQDLYPEVAEELGVLRKAGAVARVCRALSSWSLRRHEVVVAIGRCMKQRLVERGLPEQRIRVIPNWAQARYLCPVGLSENPFRRERGWQGKFVVMYSGNFGLAHPFEAILEAAKQLQTTQPQIVFAFVGTGARLPWVRQQVETRRLTNVEFLPAQPVERLAQNLNAADVHLASMHERLCGLVVPSKVYGVLAAGRPVVFLGPEDSEAARIILQHRCGDVLPSASGETVAACLAGWASDRERWAAATERLRLGSRAFGLAPAAKGFDGILRQLVEVSRRFVAAVPELLPAHAPADPQ